MTPDPARRLAVLREVAAADPEGDIAFLLQLLATVATDDGIDEALEWLA